jgi:hypothetical protein
VQTLRFLITGFAFFLIAAAQGQQEQRFVVLPASEVKAVANFYPKSGPGKIDGTWSPNMADIDGLEANLPYVAEMKGYKGRCCAATMPPDTYYRQYVAVLQGGEKRIFINALCQVEPTENWRDRFIGVFDGGNCFWHAMYNPATGHFSDLMVNGIG